MPEDFKINEENFALNSISEDGIVDFLKYMKLVKKIAKSNKMATDSVSTRAAINCAAAAIYMANLLMKEKDVSEESIQDRFKELIKNLNIDI